MGGFIAAAVADVDEVFLEVMLVVVVGKEVGFETVATTTRGGV